MKHYFIHFEDDAGHCHDEEGFKARDLESALRVARRAAGEILRDDIADGTAAVSFAICIDDARGRRLARLPVVGSIGPQLG